MTKDHLIPRRRGGGNDPGNIVTCCSACNSSRRDVDLMAWYRARHCFPTLVLLRQYLKVCHGYAKALEVLDIPSDHAAMAGLPFDATLLPEKFPDLDLIRYDWRERTN